MYNSNIMKISGVFTAGAYGIQIPTQKYAHEYFDDIDTRCAHPDQSGFVQPRHSTFTVLVLLMRIMRMKSLPVTVVMMKPIFFSAVSRTGIPEQLL